MKKRAFIGMGVAVLAILALTILSLLKPPPPTAYIRVVDERGQPVSGATIEPDGLRPKKGGGHYTWSRDYSRSELKPERVTTDAHGFAAVRYPYYVIEKLETEQISFAVDHPDFCPDRPFRVVASSPPANAPWKDKIKYFAQRIARQIRSRPDPVVLKRGGIVRVTGYVGSRENVVTNLAAEISDMWPAGTNFWQRTGSMLWSKNATPGQAHLRAVRVADQRPALFSEMVSFTVKAGETNEVLVELKRGVKVNGSVDKAVPRPIKRGRVCVHVYAEGHDGDSSAPVWAMWSPVSAEGAFEFESLPPGRMEIIGLCEGFVSLDGPPWKGRKTSQKVPQQFPISGLAQTITLPMEAAASCEVKILDDAGEPIAGARAGFWPNVLWGGNGSTIFCSDVYNSEDFFRTGTPTDWQKIRHLTEDDFRAISDRHGVALVRTLPAGQQSYSVTHSNFMMPISGAVGGKSRSASVDLSSGETGRVVVKMQKRGEEDLSH